jgi:hypothetical protein
MELIDTIPSDDIKSVSLTAMFERKLDQISKGEYDHKEFLNEINDLTSRFVGVVKGMDASLSTLSGVVCKCPICGSSIVEREKVYGCSNKECKVYILKNALGAKLITMSQAKSLLTTGSSGTKVLCQSKKTKHDFEAVMKYSYDGALEYPNELTFDFNAKALSEPETEGLREVIKPLCKCPICNSNIIDDNFKYYCSNKDCLVMISKTARGIKSLTKKDAKDLFQKGETKDRVKVISNDKEMEVYLKYSFHKEDRYPNHIDFVFDKTDDK